MAPRSFAVLLRDPSRPSLVYSGRVELEPDGVLFVCGCGGRLVRRRVGADDVVSATRGTLRLRGRAAAELVLRSGRRLDVAVLAIGGLSQLLESLAAVGPLGA